MNPYYRPSYANILEKDLELHGLFQLLQTNIHLIMSFIHKKVTDTYSKLFQGERIKKNIQ